MTHDKYILDANGEPTVEPDLLAWGRWMQTANRVVKQEEIRNAKVSTVFLGLDHSLLKPGPILWETMVFGGKLDLEQDRCGGKREQAEAMHARMVARVRGDA